VFFHPALSFYLHMVLSFAWRVQMDTVSATSHYSYGTWRYQKGWKPLHVTSAKGCWFWDASGKKYLDLSAQLMCSNLGHQNEAVVEAICKQARELAFIGPGFACDIRAQLNEKLLEVMPEGLDKFFYTTSGTEANEAAFKIARWYTGKNRIIARYTSYHGSTAGALAATGDFRRPVAGPFGTIPGVIHAPETYCYRCPIKHSYPACGLACADYLAHMIDQTGDIAAVIIEPVVGTNGVLVPPDDYLPKLADLCKKRGVLLIADEVMSGWGRTGRWFAVDRWGVKPDILCTAKGVTNAMVPLGVVATSRAIADHFEDNFFGHGHTYEAHPLTLAPAIAAIDEYKRMNLLEQAEVQGAKLGAKLRELQERHLSIGDVRGVGLFWAVDLVKNRQSKEPFNTAADKLAKKALVVDKVTADLMSQGVYAVGWMSHLVLAPPLIISDEELDFAVAALDNALSISDAHCS
jgi:taurine--2-oxoglutarate transaminase